MSVSRRFRIAADAALTAKLWGEARRHLQRLIELEQAAGDDGALAGSAATALPPCSANCSSLSAIQKSRWASMAAFTLAICARASASSSKTLASMPL